ncbi:MAG TPA: permease prefix domain 1-containing protein [Oscillospiraceae bacterium]|nr:permease prefix domain 1-containing protein [Oscillospiraceae bacterium]
MKDRVKKYIDKTFSGIYDTKELNELKEEIGSNLLERIEDLISKGHSEEDAFNKSISDLGDMSELIEGLKKASGRKAHENMYKKQSIDKKHVIGYTAASAVLLFGAMISSITYFDAQNILSTITVLTPFLIVSVGLFTYFGLTQETKQHYGMGGKRAIAYSLATIVLLLGLILTGLLYLAGTKYSGMLRILMIFVIPSAVVFIYLGLTEKSRHKADWINADWQKRWVEYYSDPKSMMIYGNIIGALWIFAFGAIPLVGIKLGWKYAWVPFVAAIGIQLIADAIFASKKR